MGFGKLFLNLIITLSVALITYNVIISANAPLTPDFPGPSTTTTSSSVFVDPIIKMPIDKSNNGQNKNKNNKNKKMFHTAVTSSDSVYNTWQCRVMYYWFKKMKGEEDGYEMGGFTRILHDGKPDHFMDEIPTFVANPLPHGMDQSSAAADSSTINRTSSHQSLTISGNVG